MISEFQVPVRDPVSKRQDGWIWINRSFFSDRFLKVPGDEKIKKMRKLGSGGLAQAVLCHSSLLNAASYIQFARENGTESTELSHDGQKSAGS